MVDFRRITEAQPVARADRAQSPARPHPIPARTWVARLENRGTPTPKNIYSESQYLKMRGFRKCRRNCLRTQNLAVLDAERNDNGCVRHTLLRRKDRGVPLKTMCSPGDHCGLKQLRQARTGPLKS